jgi:hypothetical protein
MADIFDMFAGTSAGSILTGALGTPHATMEDEPRYFANKIVDIFALRGGDLFKSPENSVWQELLIIFVVTIPFALIGYFIGRYKYDNPRVLKELEIYK